MPGLIFDAIRGSIFSTNQHYFKHTQKVRLETSADRFPLIGRTD